MRRLVALSSTISSRLPARSAASGWRGAATVKETEPEPGTRPVRCSGNRFRRPSAPSAGGRYSDQAGAAEAAAGGAVGLDEGLEQQRLLVGGDTDAGVPDLETQQDTARFRAARRSFTTTSPRG